MYHQLTIPIGAVFGRLTVIGPSRQRIRQLVSWGCRCECGNIVVAPGSLLKRGRLQSCGCLFEDGRAAAQLSHGKSRTPEYHTWSAMRARCLNPNAHGYLWYGGRGITICAAWDNFAVFLRDMGPRPSPAHSLDRIDNDGPYSPENCRWATPSVQSRNRSVTRLIEWRGAVRTLPEWAQKLGIPTTTLYRRLKDGWTVEAALLTTPRSGVRHHAPNSGGI